MKGLAGSTSSASVLALVLFPGAIGRVLGQETNDNGRRNDAADVAGRLPMKVPFSGRPSRHLQQTDDALDSIGTVSVDYLFCVQGRPQRRRVEGARREGSGGRGLCGRRGGAWPAHPYGRVF